MMKKHNILYAILLVISAACVNDPEFYGVVTENGVEYSTFDFSTTFQCDVRFEMDGRSFLYVYTEDPTDNPAATPIRTVWTDSRGFYECTLTLPKSLIGKSLYATVGDDMITAPVTSNSATFKAITLSRVTQNSSSFIPDLDLCEEIAKDYMFVMPRGSGSQNNLSKVQNMGNIPIELINEDGGTEVLFTFLTTFGWNSNFVYYYYYKGEDPVTQANRNEYIKKFCQPKFLCSRGWQVQVDKSDASKPRNPEVDDVTLLSEGGNGGINLRFNKNMGISNYLYFYGEDYDQEPKTKFPAGYKIGLILKSVDSDVKNYLLGSDAVKEQYKSQEANVASKTEVFFTNPAANYTEGYKSNVHVGQFLVLEGNKEIPITRFVYGFEDSKNTDLNFTDYLCMISTTPIVKTDKMTRLQSTYSVKTGTLLFEDLFPSQGDYDMNDVIVEYRKVKEFDSDDYIKNMYVELTPIHYGATYDDKIYIKTTNTSNNQVGNVRLADFKTVFKKSLKEICDINQAYINSHNISKVATLTVNIINDYDKGKYKEEEIPDDNIDIFIYVKETNREVHLMGRPHADIGSTNGLTENQLKYRAMGGKDGFFPWAMDIPIKSNAAGFNGFIPVTEGIRIDREYHDFLNWVNSNGKTHNDWYENSKHTPVR